MANPLIRDANSVPVAGGVSSADSSVVLPLKVSSITGRLLTDAASGSGTVTDVSVVSANGFAGSVATSTTTPAITLSTTITGVLKGDGTAISAASASTDYAALAFKTIAVSGQSDVVADSPIDTLTLVGSNITITTNAGTDTITFTGAAAGLTVGSTAIASGTNTRILYDNSGVLGEYTLSGSGTAVAMATSPILTTPNIGVATATSVNGLTITSTTGTLTITGSKVLTISNTLTLAGTDSTTMTFPTTSATIARTDAGNTFTGVSTGTAWVLTSPTITTKISPTSDDGAPLGDTTHNFSDLFLATGAVVNYANSNVVITHTSGILTMGTGELRITSANVGTNADSVPTLSSTSTLTNKTLTSPTIQTSPILAAGTNIKFTLPADLTATGDITNEFNSGYSSTAIGDLVYLDSSATWQKAKADSATTSTNLLGIALSVTASASPATVLLRGFIQAASPFPTLTVGAPVYISGATAGAVVVAQPTTTDYVIRVVGHAVHADKMWFNPSGDWITHT